MTHRAMPARADPSTARVALKSSRSPCDCLLPTLSCLPAALAADVSQGTYVARLIDGIPAQPPAPDHTRAVAALMASTDRLAALSADLNAFMRLLGRTPRSELEPYRASIRSLAGDVRVHLASAAALVAALRATRGR